MVKPKRFKIVYLLLLPLAATLFFFDLFVLPIPIFGIPVDALPIFVLTFTGLALIALFICLATGQPKYEVLKSVSGIFFFAACIPFNLNWPLFAVSIVTAIIYLKNIGQTNGKKGVVVFFLVMSCLGIPYSLWALLEPNSPLKGQGITIFFDAKY